MEFNTLHDVVNRMKELKIRLEVHEWAKNEIIEGEQVCLKNIFMTMSATYQTKRLSLHNMLV